MSIDFLFGFLIGLILMYIVLRLKFEREKKEYERKKPWGVMTSVDVYKCAPDVIRDAKSIAIPGGGRYQVFSKIVCMECGYSEIRPWREGEYVGIKLSDKCPKCGGGLTVKAIFGEPEKKIKPIGMPIQVMGGQAKISGWELLRYYLLDLFTPFKIAFRWVAKKINQRERVV